MTLKWFLLLINLNLLPLSVYFTDDYFSFLTNK
jgi:hypothetical protein